MRGYGSTVKPDGRHPATYSLHAIPPVRPKTLLNFHSGGFSPMCRLSRKALAGLRHKGATSGSRKSANIIRKNNFKNLRRAQFR